MPGLGNPSFNIPELFRDAISYEDKMLVLTGALNSLQRYVAENCSRMGEQLCEVQDFTNTRVANLTKTVDVLLGLSDLMNRLETEVGTFQSDVTALQNSNTEITNQFATINQQLQQLASLNTSFAGLQSSFQALSAQFDVIQAEFNSLITTPGQVYGTLNNDWTPWGSPQEWYSLGNNIRIQTRSQALVSNLVNVGYQIASINNAYQFPPFNVFLPFLHVYGSGMTEWPGILCIHTDGTILIDELFAPSSNWSFAPGDRIYWQVTYPYPIEQSSLTTGN